MAEETFWENVDAEFTLACMTLDQDLVEDMQSKCLAQPKAEALPPGNDSWVDVYRLTEPFDTQTGEFSLFVDKSHASFLLVQLKSDELRVVSEHKLLSTLFATLFD